MEKLKEILKNTWVKIVLLLQRFENSSFFEQMVRSFEALTPREQNNLRKSFKFLGIIILAFLILSGPLSLISKIKKIKTLEKLEADAFMFHAEYESKNKGYTPPVGWMPISANSAADLTENFNTYLARIGVPESCGTLILNGENLNLTLKEISLKQATRILFQLEALYPKIKTTKFISHPNSNNREILNIEASFEFNSAVGSQFAQGSMGSQGYPDEETNSPADSRDEARPPSFSSGEEASNSFPQGDDFIPPPPGGENFDEFIPPEMPDDIPPPPPPPGFEGGGE
jgi:hypothetical protein